MRTVVIAHAGGWDEIALIAVPVIVYLLVSRIGRKGGDGPPSTPPDAGT